MAMTTENSVSLVASFMVFDIGSFLSFLEMMLVGKNGSWLIHRQAF
jgi:hypothetical protein